MQLRATRLTAIASAVKRAFNIRSLFAGGAPGVWYDPSDMSTLFQDSAGTVPVTAVEQPVGLMLDKSQGLVLGPELLTGVIAYNLNSTISIVGNTITATCTVAGQFGFISQSNLVTNGVFAISGNISANPSGKAISVFPNLDGAAVSLGSALISFSLKPFAPAAGGFSANSAFLVNGGIIGDSFSITLASVKKIAGNHAFQATSASRPVLSARYNLLTKTEQFDDAVWSKNNATVTANAAVAPDGTTTADKLVASFVASEHSVGQAISTLSGVVAMSFAMKQGEWRYGFIRTRDSGGVYRNVIFDLTDGSAVLTDTGWSNVGSTPLGDGWYRCFGTMTIPLATNFATGGATNSPSTISVAGDGTSGIYIWGASLVPTNQSTLPYQRVNTATDYNTTGFLPFLKFDGVDDSLSTNSINFTSTDKMSVFAGVRKLSDAATAIAVELSASAASNVGAFFVAAPVSAGATYTLLSQGNVLSLATSPSSYASPITNVVTGLGNISGDLATLRINGAQIAQSTADQGTGNYGNYPLYIGRRNNASLPFNGQMYSMIIVGKAVTAGELSSTEKFVASKTGVTL